MKTLGTYLAAIAIVVAAFFIGRWSCPPPPDGNPVGYHLHGLVVMDQQASLSACAAAKPCTLSLDVYFNPSSNPSTTASCNGVTACATFHNLQEDKLASQLSVKVDEATGGGYSSNVYASGAVGQ